MKKLSRTPFKGLRLFEKAPDLQRNVLVGLYGAYSEWQKMIYPEIIKHAPVDNSKLDPRKDKLKGLVRRSIQLEHRKGHLGIRYITITVPGFSNKGTDAARAMDIINIHHIENGGRPITFAVRNKRFLTFPLSPHTKLYNPEAKIKPYPGGKGTWVACISVTQNAWFPKKKNWIDIIVKRTRPSFDAKLIKLSRGEKIRINRKTIWVKVKS